MEASSASIAMTASLSLDLPQFCRNSECARSAIAARTLARARAQKQRAAGAGSTIDSPRSVASSCGRPGKVARALRVVFSPPSDSRRGVVAYIYTAINYSERPFRSRAERERAVGAFEKGRERVMGGRILNELVSRVF